MAEIKLNKSRPHSTLRVLDVFSAASSLLNAFSITEYASELECLNSIVPFACKWGENNIQEFGLITYEQASQKVASSFGKEFLTNEVQWILE